MQAERNELTGAAAVWLAETLELAAELAAGLPQLLLAQDEAAASEPDLLGLAEKAARAASGTAGADAAAEAGGRREMLPGLEEAAGVAAKKPQVNAGASNILRLEMPAAYDVAVRQEAPPEAAAETDRETEPGAATPGELAAWLAAEPLAAQLGEALFEPLTYAAVGAREAVWSAAVRQKLLGGTAAAPEGGVGGTAFPVERLLAAAEQDRTIAIPLFEAASPALRERQEETDGAAPLLARFSTSPAGETGPDAAAIAQEVAERLRERLEIILQSRPFVG